jgi:NAD(P)H-dependent FMN reductase
LLNPLLTIPRIAVIEGSARKKSSIYDAFLEAAPKSQCVCFDLKRYVFFPYDYSGLYPDHDEFLLLIRSLLAFPVWVFSTPVYWYSMSGWMKQFFDRWTDLITIYPDLGRALAGRQTLLISSCANVIPDGFELPFREISAYFQMSYCGSFFQIFPENSAEKKDHNDREKKRLQEIVLNASF